MALTSLPTIAPEVKKISNNFNAVFDFLDSNLVNKDSYPRAITDHDSYAADTSRRHVYGHHHTQFEKETFGGLSPRTNLETFNKKQHFIHGKPPCGSSSNLLAYGGMPATAPRANSKRSNAMNFTGSFDETTMYQSAGKKSTGLLYGEHDTEVGRPQPRKMREKDGLPPWMKDKTSAELRKREMQSREIEEDLTRSRLEKASQRAHKVAEQKKDLEMLQNYRPWGKPGGGAPRGVENDRTATIRTRHVTQLAEDRDQVMPFGKPGGGAPNRTESGRIKTKLAADTHIRLRAHQDGRPVDFIPMKHATAAEYRTDLDRLAEETRHRRHMEKEQDFEHDLQTLKYDPFGRPGGGAPLKGDDGSPRAGLPMHLSNDIYELRTTEPKHPHAFSGSENNNHSVLPREEVPKNENRGKVHKQESDDDMDQGFLFGMPGGGAPMRDKNGRVVAHVKQTLVKDGSGALVKSPTKRNETYFPFGRPGGGAPIRDDRGKVRANVTGIVENEQVGRPRANHESMEAKKEYLATLMKMKEDQEQQRNKDKSDLFESGQAVSDWLRGGAIGHPKYDPYTHEIKADSRVTSDITRQRMNIQPQATEKSRVYHNELDEIVRQREEQRKNDTLQQRQRSVEHAKTMERAWGRPGNGAPNADTKKAKIEMMPADYGSKWRDD